jgi:hypothetical protein
MFVPLLLAATLAQTAPLSADVRPVTRSFHVDLRARVVSFELQLRSADGTRSYLFWCEGGTDFAGLNALAERHQTNPAGALMCVLNAGAARAEGSLLADADEPPWSSRAMFRAEQLEPGCADDPDFGQRRVFRTPGLLLTLAATHVRTDAKGVRFFTLDVTIQSAPGEFSLQADRSRERAPSGNSCNEARVSGTGRHRRS